MDERKHRRRSSDTWHDRLLIASVVVNLVAIVTLAAISPRVLLNQQELEGSAEEQALHEADFRICAREVAGRADLHAAATDRGEVELRRARERRLPILDCSPNLDGEQAELVPVTSQRRFVRLYVDGRAPVFCGGRILAFDTADDPGRPPPCRGVRPLR